MPNNLILSALKSLPNDPGVYQYFDINGRLLYVGKAKNLKKRVKSYWKVATELAPNPDLSARIIKMLNEAANIEWIITGSEADALILENSFIKQLRPKYNILLRDDKTYPYIYIDLSAAFPRPEITRKVIKGSKIRYFGPFFRGANEILEAIYSEFKLVQKASCLREKRACLFYQIGRCTAPCEDKISKEDYAKIVENAVIKLKNPSALILNLEAKMAKNAANELYEEAAKLRDQINAIKAASASSVAIDLARLEDFELFAASFEDKMACVVHFSIRDGKLSASNHKIVATDIADDSDLNELYNRAILEAFASDAPVASTKIYTALKLSDEAVLEDILHKRHNKKFEIISPKIGEKKAICEVALKNCAELMKKEQKSNIYALLNELKEQFSLNNLPAKIEAFDNSHMMGEAAVGAMIACENGEFKKEHYRHYHLNSNNDYEQMRSTLTTRALRFDKLAAPDLWVIDGGEILRRLAEDIIKSSGANVDIIAISKEKSVATGDLFVQSGDGDADINKIIARSKAKKTIRSKGGASDILYINGERFLLDKNDKKLQFIQRLRDEAHRFAISFHKKSKKRADLARSKLTNAGISEGSVAKLVRVFGGFKAIYAASSEQIASATNKNVARKIEQIRSKDESQNT